MLGVAKLFASILAGDWEEAGEALVDITKGAMQALTGVIAAGWDAIATGIGVGRAGDPRLRVWPVVEHRAVDRGLDQPDDRPDQRVHSGNQQRHRKGRDLSPDDRAHQSQGRQDRGSEDQDPPRWSETEIGKNLDAVLRKEEEEEEEEDIDKEFEDEPEPLLRSILT